MKTTILSLDWWYAAGIRAIKTMAQAALSIVVLGLAAQDIDWLYVGSISLVAGIFSLLTSLKGLPEVDQVRIDSQE